MAAAREEVIKRVRIAVSGKIFKKDFRELSVKTDLT
jgi:hypothetical protein